MEVGNNLVLGEGVILELPAKITNTEFQPVLLAGGEITGTFSKTPANAVIRYEGNTVLVKKRGGTLFMLK
jgi:hypothetical protein